MNRNHGYGDPVLASCSRLPGDVSQYGATGRRLEQDRELLLSDVARFPNSTRERARELLESITCDLNDGRIECDVELSPLVAHELLGRAGVIEFATREELDRLFGKGSNT